MLSISVRSFRTTDSLSLHYMLGNEGIMKALLISCSLHLCQMLNPEIFHSISTVHD